MPKANNLWIFFIRQSMFLKCRTQVRQLILDGAKVSKFVTQDINIVTLRSLCTGVRSIVREVGKCVKYKHHVWFSNYIGNSFQPYYSWLVIMRDHHKLRLMKKWIQKLLIHYSLQQHPADVQCLPLLSAILFLTAMVTNQLP